VAISRPGGRLPRRAKKGGQREDPLVAFCRSLPGATEDVKWGNNLIFSVGGKMFAGFDLPEGQPLAFKVETLAFAALVAHDGIVPAPYMAKHSWVSVTDRAALPQATLEDLLAEAHRLIAEKLPRKTRLALGL
jgi:predicted DNA-binding protein (MmcQ/YjbR family)